MHIQKKKIKASDRSCSFICAPPKWLIQKKKKLNTNQINSHKEAAINSIKYELNINHILNMNQISLIESDINLEYESNIN